MKRTGASVANLAASVIKGVADFGEALIDTGAVVVSAPLTIITAGQDIAQSLKSGKGLKDIDFKNTKELWAGTMSMVAEDTVGNAFNKFYSDTKIGNWLDTNAYTPFKSTGAVTKVAEGLGQIAGVVALTVLTGGATTPVMAAKISSVIAGMRGFGEGAEYFWGKQRDSSWEGVERKYQNGEISQEAMETYNYIRSMSENEIYRLYREGKVTQEEYKAMLEIKQMPEGWITAKNTAAGLLYALATGSWEAAQFYVGNLLNDFSIKGLSAFANAATRVGIDTGFNAADTPFRAGVESLLTGRNFKDIFEELGGTKAVISSAFVGLIGSVIGEYATHKTNKNSKIGQGSNTYQGLANNIEEAKEKYKSYIAQLQKRGIATSISDDDIEKGFKKIIRINNDTIANLIMGKNTLAFNTYGYVFIRDDTTTSTIIHEVNHSLGSYLGKICGIYSEYRGINEALTELIAIKMCKGVNDSVYWFNVETLNNMINTLNYYGYSVDLDSIAYFSTKNSIEKNILKNVFDRNCRRWLLG